MQFNLALPLLVSLTIQPGTAFTSQLNNSTCYFLYQKTKSLITAGMSAVRQLNAKEDTQEACPCVVQTQLWLVYSSDEIPSQAVDEFRSAIKVVICDVSFDNDVIVSVFETNITVLG